MATSVTGHLEPLRRLQTVDAELYRLRGLSKQKPLELDETRRRVAGQQTTAQSSDAALKQWQMSHKQKEMELSTKEESIKKLQGQLFQVKTNKEYSAMQHEIDQAKADISLLEEDILKLLDQIDQAKREFTTQQAALVKEQQTLKAEETRIERELTQLREQMAAQQQQRDAIVPTVPKEALQLYERILASRDGIALVPLLGDRCGACNMNQPPQVVNQVHLRNVLVVCDSCNRLLYLDESQLSS